MVVFIIQEKNKYIHTSAMYRVNYVRNAREEEGGEEVREKGSSGEEVDNVIIINLTKMKKREKIKVPVRCCHLQKINKSPIRWCHLPVAMTFTLGEHLDQNVLGGVASDALQ